MTAANDLPRVLYVMGAARSGSTALGTAIENHGGAFYAGELDAWLRRDGVPNFGGVEREHFWYRVADRVRGADELPGKTARNAFEHPRSLPRRRTRQRLRGQYQRVARDLYAAIAAESGRDWIVDSSHYPLRARELRRAAGLELHVVLLVRDPRAVVASFARRDIDQPAKGKLAANLYLWVTHGLSAWVYLRWPRERRHFVRYEQFLADPATALAGLPTSAEPGSGRSDLRDLRTGLAFQGNRLLRQPVITLTATTGDLPRDRTTTALQAPWLALLRLLEHHRA